MVLICGGYLSDFALEELLILCRTMQRGSRGLTLLNRLRHCVEVTGTHFTLVLDRSETTVGGGEFCFLQLDEGGHLVACVAVREVEHGVVQCMETCQRDELELVTHCAQLFLEFCDRSVVQILLPVERWRAVV